MLTLLFGVDVLVSGWTTALFLAILLAIFFGQTHLYQSTVRSKEATTQNRFHKFYIRWTARFTVVGVLATVLAILLSLDPVPNSGLAPVFELFRNDFWQGKNRFVLDDLEVTFIVLFLILFVTVTNRLYDFCTKALKTGGTTIFGPSAFKSLIFSPGHRLRPR